MTINFALLDQSIVDAAKQANGFQHYQGDWVSAVNPEADTEGACGTALCLAGFAAVRAGAEIPKPTRDYRGVWYFSPWRLDLTTGKLVEAEAGGKHVSEFASDRLGLTLGQAEALFASSNTLDELYAMRDHLRENPDADNDELCAVRDGYFEGRGSACTCGCDCIDY